MNWLKYVILEKKSIFFLKKTEYKREPSTVNVPWKHQNQERLGFICIGKRMGEVQVKWTWCHYLYSPLSSKVLQHLTGCQNWLRPVFRQGWIWPRNCPCDNNIWQLVLLTSALPSGLCIRKSLHAFALLREYNPDYFLKYFI